MSSKEMSAMEEGMFLTVKQICYSSDAVKLMQKVIAEVEGTYFVIFAGCGSVVVNKLYDGIVTFPGISVVWGLICMVMIYSVGHISGAHFNPAVTITFCIFRRFPMKQIGELAGIAVGMTITLNVFVVGPVSGASMNPARTLGPAIVMRVYDGIWVYMVGPMLGTILGGFVYKLIRFTDKPLSELTRSSSFVKSMSKSTATATL
ncbi:hypothetical protein ES332_A03G149200v1 [Gossypium tomentosum]|uniref:Aquaporin n=1 Tax=Gossypium tomentosum TaxID=34277 RepID=A0A5D2R6P4_GOSTO|nr:hypothetical protein ES332_A03G149200v1 [Gossypium tomentosum]